MTAARPLYSASVFSCDPKFTIFENKVGAKRVAGNRVATRSNAYVEDKTK